MVQYLSLEPIQLPLDSDLRQETLQNERKLQFFHKAFTLGAEAVIGVMDSKATENLTQSLDGYFVNVQTFIKVPL